MLKSNGGSLGEPGSVAYLFDKKGLIVVDGERYSEDDLLVAVDAGAEDISMDDDVFEILCDPSDLTAVRASLDEAGIDIETAEISQLPQVRVPLDEDAATKVLKLIDALEEQAGRAGVRPPGDVLSLRLVRGRPRRHRSWRGRHRRPPAPPGRR